jgi:hypothetical protein
VRGKYHALITIEALRDHFSRPVLEILLSSGAGQDGLGGQIWHPEYHYDASKFREGDRYVEQQRLLVLQRLHSAPFPGPVQLKEARLAFGRLLHAVQDFYAHSNYAALWLEQRYGLTGEIPGNILPGISPEDIDIQDTAVLQAGRLCSGKFYFPIELLSFIPALETLALRFLPEDSHARMNLDHPGRGSLFPYAYAAAVKHTRLEYTLVAAEASPDALSLFSGLHEE